ncbi:hypothetical protein OV203_01560 [Nannocystis sp. ILAH1]|uniref:hypothetical protein n=1 Tax=Nannocystis sp. ILAH1 TaxID=2996789 RepID=UPI00226D5996|nr:hypothetical protein [Nannocystis sp. ILAH1]MCY0985798.1 hypothetical protein [Nannocystis sp. ILAH1]
MPDHLAALGPLNPPSHSSSSGWWWFGGLVAVGTTLGVVWWSRANSASASSGSTGSSGSGGNPPVDEPKPPELEGWPFQVAVGSTQTPNSARWFRFFRVTPPNAVGPVVWVLHGQDTDPRKLAPWIPTSLADVVFVQAPQGWLAAGTATAAASELWSDASLGKLPGPFDHGKKTRPWVVVGYDVGADVALQMAASTNSAASPDAVVAVAPLEPGKLPGAGGDKRWIAFVIGDKDPQLASVQAAAELAGKPASAGGAGYNTAVRVVAGAGHELPPLGPQLRDLLLDLFSMYPYPS